MLIAFFYVAISVEAVTAALSAGRRDMDWLGVCLLACATALGGGSARDVLLGNYPLPWVAHPHYIIVVLCAAIITIVLARFMEKLKLVFLLLDAMGLALFSVIGCNVALEMGQPALIVILAGMITGVTGGVIRDILCNEVPLLFRGELYASVSIVTGLVYLGGLHIGAPAEIVSLIAIVFGFGLRTLAILYSWQMPKFIYTKDWH